MSLDEWKITLDLSIDSKTFQKIAYLADFDFETISTDEKKKMIYRVYLTDAISGIYIVDTYFE